MDLNKVFGVNISYQLNCLLGAKTVDPMPENINENKASRDIEIVKRMTAKCCDHLENQTNL